MHLLLSQRRGFCTGGNLAKVRGRGQRSWRQDPSPRAPLGLCECKKSLFIAEAQKSTVRSTSTSSAYCVKECRTVKAKCVLIWRVLITDRPTQGQQMYTTCTVYLTDMPLMLLKSMSLIIHITPGHESASCLLVQLKKLCIEIGNEQHIPSLSQLITLVWSNTNKDISVCISQQPLCLNVLHT